MPMLVPVPTCVCACSHLCLCMFPPVFVSVPIPVSVSVSVPTYPLDVSTKKGCCPAMEGEQTFPPASPLRKPICLHTERAPHRKERKGKERREQKHLSGAQATITICLHAQSITNKERQNSKLAQTNLRETTTNSRSAQNQRERDRSAPNKERQKNWEGTCRGGGAA